MKEKKDFEVKLIGSVKDCQTIAVAGALGCFEEKSSAQLLKQLKGFWLTRFFTGKKRLKKEEGVLKNSLGRGHGSIADQVYFIFSVEDLPRAVTLEFCFPEYSAHLQQSLRRAKADRGFYLPEIIKNSSLGSKTYKILSQSFELYERMCEAKIPGEDARFLLPLYTKTNIQTTISARELCHFWWMSKREGVPRIAATIVEELIVKAKKKAPYLFKNYGFNFEPLSWYPAAHPYSPHNETLKNLVSSLDRKEEVVLISHNANSFPINQEIINKAVRERDEAEISNLKHIHFDFVIFESLAALHQAIRQRTWNHSIESIYDAVKDAIVSEERMAAPSSIMNSEFYSEYKAQNQDMLNLYKELVDSGIPESEAVGVIPHSVKIYDFIHVNGWNIIHSIGKRTCTTAQWEIRKIAKKIAEIIKKEMPSLGKWAEPQCITYGKCPETKDCGYYRKYQK